MIPNFFNASTLLFTFLSFNLLDATLIILKLGNFYRFRMSSSNASSVRELWLKFTLIE